MIKNIVYVSGIIITLASYYVLYEYQNSKFSNIENQLNALNQKLDSITLNTDPPLNNTAINYKENNVVKNEIINFSDSLIKLFDNDEKTKKISQLQGKDNSVTIDTFCYDLSEQYKIINFYNNKIRIKKSMVPGSILMSVNDSLIHNNTAYVLKQINGEGSFVKFKNLNDNNHCKLHKIKP
jgi:hypothetical protein